MGIFACAVLAGLLLQLVVLPYVFPQLHAGDGLLAGRDWVGFHAQAVAESQRILQDGWGAFRLRPDGDNSIIGITGFFYVLFGPHPWTLLPLSAAMFATGGAALFSMLKQLDLEDNEAIIAMMPYLLFPSSLLQYGQIHKDVFCTAAVMVVLWSWSSLLRQGRKPAQMVSLIAISAVALITMSVFRPYFMHPFLGLGVLILFWYLVRTIWQFFRFEMTAGGCTRMQGLRSNLLSIAILAVLSACVYFMSISLVDVRIRPFPSSDVHASLGVPDFRWSSNRDVRSADALRVFIAPPSKPDDDDSPEARKYRAYLASPAYALYLEAQAEAARIKAVQQCRAVLFLRDDAFIENTINRGFLKIAVARAGFTASGGPTAASNIDNGINFCKNEDLIRYIPRAFQIAFFAPFPSNWFAVEKRNSSSIEIYISAVEMFYCYIAYFGLLYWLFSYRRWSVSLLVPITFVVGMSLLLGLVVANLGTLYRMRFPFAMIFVSIGMAGIFQLVKIRPSWVENSDSNSN